MYLGSYCTVPLNDRLLMEVISASAVNEVMQRMGGDAPVSTLNLSSTSHRLLSGLPVDRCYALGLPTESLHMRMTAVIHVHPPQVQMRVHSVACPPTERALAAH